MALVAHLGMAFPSTLEEQHDRRIKNGKKIRWLK